MLTVYGIYSNGNLAYIGYTSRELRVRLNEHRSRGVALPGDTIRPICTRSTVEAAESCETHLIALVGLGRLRNQNYKRNDHATGGSHTQESRAAISRFHKGKKWSLGRKYTEEYRKKLSSSMRGIKKREGAINEKLAKTTRPFLVFKDGVFVGEFVNQTHAAIACGMKKSTFVDIFKGKRIDRKGLEITHV